METSLLVSIIIAVVAIVPGIWALVNQINKDKIQVKMDMARVGQEASLNLIGPLQEEINRLREKSQALEYRVQESKYKIGSLSANSEITEEKIWKRMYEKPVIVRCEYCNAGNVITNTECIKCGAPIGGKNA
jgi:peptidoglycan hydrolase CwlO-like protein